ncbi:unnamed protein product, partial [Closterium sp. Naga37s-1]
LPPVVSVESFVHAADHDGDGEIGPEEAHQLWARVLEEEKRFEEQEAEASGGEREREAGESETGGGESSMADLMSDHRLDMPFSYGGSSISTAEMSDHLSHMLTGEKVVAWIVHGLRLPQYAEVFRANSIDGLDFPTLISDNGTFLKEDLGVKSALHRHKIHTAIFRQVFGLGKAPGAPTNLECEPAGCGAIAVQWDPPANPGVPPVHKYLIQRRVATRVASWKDVGDTSEDAWLDSAGLKPGIEYTYRIQAWGGHGPSEWVVLDHCRALATSADGVACTMGVHPHQQQHHHQHHHQHQQHALKPPAMEPLGRPIAAGAEGHSHPHASDIVAVTGAEKQQGSGGSWQKRLESVGGTEYILSASTAPGPGVAAEEAVGRTIGGVGGQQGSRHGVAQSADQSAKEAEQEAERRGEESPSSPLWSFIWSVNGGILVLGIFSRHSFFFRFVLAAAASAHRLLRPLASALSPSPASPFLLVRVAARALLGLRAAAARVSALLHRVIAALVSPGDDEGGEDYELSPFPSGSRAARRWSDGLGDQADGGLGAGEGNALGEAGEAGGRGFRGGWGGGGGESWAAGGGMGGGQGMRRVGRNRSYDELSGRQEGEASFGSSEGGMPRNGLLARGGHEEARARVGEWRGEEGEGGGWGESGRVQEAASDEDTESMKSVSFKYRCNAEGCRVRFDRWYTLDGLRHSILKHYCRECQGVYCVRHTRISPHSSRTQCGLDSHCLCFSCYARLPAELQLRAERINKLRVGPVAGSGSSGSASLGNSFGGSGGGGGGRNGGGKNGEGVLNGSGNSNSFSSSGHGSSGSIRAGGNGDGGKGVGGKISPSSSWMTLLGRRNNDKSGGADKGGRERHVGGSLAESASTSGSDESQGAGAGGGVAGAVGAGGAGGAGRTAEAGEAVSGSVLAAAAEAAGEEQDTGMVELSLAAADLLPAASPTSPDPSNGSSRATSEPDMGAPSKRPGAASGVADIWNSLQESQDLRSGTGSNALPNTPGEALACLTGKGPLPRSAASDPTSSCLASAARPTCSLEAIPSCSESVREAEESRGKGGGVAAAGGRCVKLEAAGSRGEGAGKRGETNGNGAIDWGRLERCPSHLSRSRSSRSADEVKRSPSPFSKLKEGSGKGTLGSDKGRGEAERGGQEEEGEVGNGGSRATSAFLSPFVSLASSFKRLFKRRSSPEPALQPQQHDVAGLVPEAAQQARKRGVPELETARTSQNGTSSRISSAAGNFFSQPPRPLQLSSSLADATGTAGRRPHAAHAGVADGGLAERAAGAAVAPRSPLQQGYSGEYGQHKQQTQRGMAQQGMAQQGVAQQGMAQQGMAQQGMAQQGMAQQGMARQGMAQQGMAQQGMAQQGMARQGMAQQGMAQAQGSGGVGHVWRPGAHIPRTAVPAPLVPAPRVQTPRAPSAHVPAPPVPAPLKAPAPIAAAAAAAAAAATSPLAGGTAAAAPPPPPIAKGMAVTAGAPIPLHTPAAVRATVPAARAAAGAAAARAAGPRGKREASREKDRNMVAFLLNMLTSLQPSPPSANPLSPSAPPMPTSSAFSHPLVRNPVSSPLPPPHRPPPSHPAVSPTHLGAQDGRLSMEEMLARLQQQWQAHRAGSTGTSKNGKKKSKKRAGAAAGGETSRNGQEELVSMPTGNSIPGRSLGNVRAFHVSEALKNLWDADAGLALFRGRDAANLARVVEEMREDGCEHNAVTLQSLATAYGRAGRWDEALATLGAMQGGDGGQSVLHDLTLIGPRVDTLFRMSRYVDAIKAFTELRSARHVPDSFVYNTVFTCYGRVGNSSGAEEAFKDMIRHGVPLDVRCANSLMDVYGRTGRVDDAMAVFDRMCLAAVAASGASHMKGGGGGGLARERGGNRSNADLPGAAAVAGIPPLIPHVAADNASTLHGSAARAITYSCAIHLLSMAGRLTEAEETFEAMLVAGKRHDTITWSTMVQMWAKEANLERAVMWFKRMVAAGCRPETPAYNSLMWAFVGRGMFDEAGEVLTALKNGWDLVGQVELVGRGEEQELKQGGSGKSVFGWLNPRGEGELGPGDANKGVAGAVSPSKQGNAKLELAPNLMTYTMFLSECTESAARSDVARLLRLMEETEHAAHTVFQLLTEEPFESTHTLLPAGAESDSESAPLSGAVCEAGSAAGCEASDGETRSIQLPAISGQGGECFVDLHGMSAGTAVTVTKWALEKMRQAVVASAAAGAASGASAASSSVVSTVAISSTAANPTASGETAEGAIQGEEALVESLSPSESGAAESSRLHESPPAHPLQWQQPSKVAVVTGWGKRSRVQGASLVKAAVEALLLRDLTAPFSLHRFHPGSYEAPGADLEHWLLSPGVEQLLAPRDEG